MKQAVILCMLISAFSLPSFSEEPPQKLDRIVVTPSRIASLATSPSRSVTTLTEASLKSAPYEAIADIINALGGVDIRRRGPNDVQADVAIRGTTFEQNTVMIDGVAVNDPQTGHHTMDLAVTAADIDRIEVLKGPVSNLYGANSFGGAINIITKKPAGRRVVIDGEGGSFDYASGGFSVTQPLGIINNRFSFNDHRSTGYMPETDFNILSIANTSSIATAYGTHSFLFGYTKKDFGADSFYSNLFPNEEEHTDTRFFKLDSTVEHDDVSLAPKLFLRRHRDKFALDRNRPGWQTNYHTTYTYGGEMSFGYTHRLVDIAGGTALKGDTIDSTNLGKHARGETGVYIEVSPHLSEKLALDIGIREDYFSGFGWEYAPSASLRYRLTESVAARGAIGRSYRIPTFTDLYYRDAANIGNADLKPEHSWTYEAGFDCAVKGATASIVYFHRDASQTIDWTRRTAQDPWQIANIGTVDTNGVEVSARCGDIFVEYTALDSYRKHDYLSKYALDYLKHELSCGGQWDIFGFKNTWVLNWRKRIGDSGYIVVDTKVRREIVRKGGVVFEAFLDITNLFDTAYSEQSDIAMPGRWIKSGARIEF